MVRPMDSLLVNSMDMQNTGFAQEGQTTAADYEYRSAIGQDSHRFLDDQEAASAPGRQLILGGVTLPGERPLAGNSDADVCLHALTNAISGLTGINILGTRADHLCLEQGITDSRVFLWEALATLNDWRLCHVSITMEGKRPRLTPWVTAIKNSLASLTGLDPLDIGLTATSGEDLTAFGRGEGLQAFCLITARRPDHR
jgi:2-C-methyl-D-erythritol 2,4-cyclodiphosphate synthase